MQRQHVAPKTLRWSHPFSSSAWLPCMPLWSACLSTTCFDASISSNIRVNSSMSILPSLSRSQSCARQRGFNRSCQQGHGHTRRVGRLKDFVGVVAVNLITLHHPVPEFLLYTQCSSTRYVSVCDESLQRSVSRQFRLPSRVAHCCLNLISGRR